MAKNRDEEELLLARQLMELGCPLDLQFFPSDSRRLHIHQVGGFIESRVFDMECNGTGYMLDLEIVSDLANPIYLRRFELELPWNDPLFYWLPDPRERGKKPDLYRFAGERLEYPRADVINHCIGRISRFKHGDLLSGLVLGQGPQGIPDRYKHGNELRAKFSVIDQFGTGHSAEVLLYVDRSAKLMPRQPKMPRRTLFAPAISKGIGAVHDAKTLCGQGLAAFANVDLRPGTRTGDSKDEEQ